jgi:hypothetical protein
MDAPLGQSLVTVEDGGSTFLQNVKMNSLCYVV